MKNEDLFSILRILNKKKFEKDFLFHMYVSKFQKIIVLLQDYICKKKQKANKASLAYLFFLKKW